jgi:nicotinamidase/pyrazinamidase
MQNVHLVIIDPQNDFMDQPDAALGVPGATNDMQRVAKTIDRLSKKIRDIHATQDTHRGIDVAHPPMWIGQDGSHPIPYTPISYDDICADIWKPRNEHLRPKALGGKTIGEFMRFYTEQLEQKGLYQLMIWPEHCLVGSPGHNIQPDIYAAFRRWEDANFAAVDYILKGTCPWVEHYGALMAEVQLPNDPTTTLNTDFLSVLQTADAIAMSGEAASHCVKSTVNQVVNNIGDAHLSKIYLLTDCMSSVPKICDGPDFPAITEQWYGEMESRGLNLTTSEEFLA